MNSDDIRFIGGLMLAALGLVGEANHVDWSTLVLVFGIFAAWWSL